MANQWIYPTTMYGQLSDVYGTAVTAYANTNGFPPGSGMVLGTRGLLYDFTETALVNVGTGGAAQFSAVTYTIGNSNMFAAVVTTTTANTIPIVGVLDRSGSTALVANNIAWMTTRGLATSLVAASQTAPKFLVSSTTAGSLIAATAGTSIQSNILQLNTTTTAGSYPVQIL
jgi:hypothetical protein